MVDRSCQVTEDEIIRSLANLQSSDLHDKNPRNCLEKSQSFCSLPEERLYSGSLEEGYVPRLEHLPASGMDILDMQGVCEDVGGADHEEFFNKKFDQLAKLHELYQSVSSINAKCQSRLENDREAIELNNLPDIKNKNKKLMKLN